MQLLHKRKHSSGAPSRGRTGTPLFRKAADFKSAVSTNFTIGAPAAERTPASQRNPGSACAQCPVASVVTGTETRAPPRKKGSLSFPLEIWSGKRVSNSRPQPWQGCALPTELFPHFANQALLTQCHLTSLTLYRYFWVYPIANPKQPTFRSDLPEPPAGRSSGSSDLRARDKSGGAVRSRTGLTGFAIRGITALLPRQKSHSDKKGKQMLPFLWKLEREKSLELSTSTLARLRSTN